MIEKTKIGYQPVTVEDVRWTVDCYSHLLPLKVSLTGAQFAELIAQVYDCERNIKNGLASRFAKQGIVSIEWNGENIKCQQSREVLFRTMVQLFNAEVGNKNHDNIRKSGGAK